MRQRCLIGVLALMMIFGSTAVHAEVKTIDPFEEPEISLSEADAQKVRQLQDLTFPAIVSDISPDDSTVVISGYRYSQTGLAFLDVNTGAITPVPQPEGEIDFTPITEVVWADDREVIFVGFDFATFDLALVSIDRTTGAIELSPIALPAYPLSIAPNASRMLVLLPTEEGEVELQSTKRPSFDLSLPRPGFEDRPNKTRYDSDLGPRKMASEDLAFGVIDLTTGVLTPISILPAGSDISSFTWTPDGSKIAMVRTTFPLIDRDGERLAEVSVQDGLGAVPPAENPFYNNNYIDVFDFSNGGYQTHLAAANQRGVDIFGRIHWSTDGRTLMAQMFSPSEIAGRRYPVYQNPDRSYLRFYDQSLNLINTFDRPETEAAYGSFPQFVSPDEVIITAPYGALGHLYYYNRGSGEFREVSPQEGTYYQVITTRQSRKLIYNYSSFYQAPELFRVAWDGTALAQLSWSNDALTKASQVRASKISFTLQNGIVRSGWLIQPASAAFPPSNAPMVMWQEGGPGPAMTNQWGSNVENPYNLLPNFGISVVMVPLAGREGLGYKAFNALADHQNFGQVDIDEGAEIVAQLIARGYTTSSQIGVTGCSYGGYFASQSIARHPNLYAAANTQCTLLDLLDEFQFGFSSVIAYLEGQSPTSNPAEYIADSPTYNAAKIRTPTLIFHGEFDFLAVSLALNFHDQIAANGTPTKMFQFGFEGHGLGLPNSQFKAAQEQIAWFRTYLTPGSNRTSLAEAAPLASAPVVAAPVAAPVDAAPVAAAPAAPVFQAAPSSAVAVQAAPVVAQAAPVFVVHGPRPVKFAIRAE